MSVAQLATLNELAQRIAPVQLAGERVLEFVGPLAQVFPGGGPVRGSVLGLTDPSLIVSLCAEISALSNWVAVVGLASFGFAAVAERGGRLDRVVSIATPSGEHLPVVLGALVDAVTLTVLGPGVAVGPVVARRLSARARERGSLIAVAGDGRRVAATRAWPEVPDLVLRVEQRRWSGLGHGYGVLSAIDADIVVEGRRAGGRTIRRSVTLATTTQTWMTAIADESLPAIHQSASHQSAIHQSAIHQSRDSEAIDATSVADRAS